MTKITVRELCDVAGNTEKGIIALGDKKNGVIITKQGIIGYGIPHI